MSRLIRFLVVSMVLLGLTAPVSAQGSAIIRLLDRNGAPTSRLTDGNRIQLSLKLPAPVQSDSQAEFLLEGLDKPVASCTVAAGADTCSSETFAALGWYWGAKGVAQPGRVLHVAMGGQQLAAALEITIKPRPVVMVHGFLSNWETWKAYLGPGGYLASIGLKGFAVGMGRRRA